MCYTKGTQKIEDEIEAKVTHSRWLYWSGYDVILSFSRNYPRPSPLQKVNTKLELLSGVAHKILADYLAFCT